MENEDIVDIIEENSDEEILKRYMLKCLEQGDNNYLRKVISNHHIVVKKTDTPKRQRIKHKLKQDTDISKVKAINAVKEIISCEKSISGGSSSSSSCASTTDVVAISNYVINTLLEKKLKETEKKEAIQKNGNFMKFLVVLLPILFTGFTNLIQYYTFGCHTESD